MDAGSRTLRALADELLLGPLLARLGSLTAEEGGRVELLAHWAQGEFHHDYVLRVAAPARALPGDLPGPILVVSTNCNAGVKELMCLADPPARWALWHHRCPDNDEFEGALPAPPLDVVRTVHAFDPCILLAPDARSELRPDARARQRGGGWIPLDSPEERSRRETDVRQ